MGRAFSKILILLILGILIVGGFFAWQYFGTQEKATENETADWKIYRNEQYGFEMKYPLGKPSLEVLNKDHDYFGRTTFQVITIDTSLAQESNLPTRTPTGGINIYTDTDTVWLEHCLESVSIASGVAKTQSEPVDIEEINGIRFSVFDESSAAMGGQAMSEKSYRVIHNNACYRIQSFVAWRSIDFYHGATDLEPATEQELQEEKKLVQNQIDFNNQILSTFKFSEENETTNWKIYKNEEYNYEIKYPPELDNLRRIYGNPELGTPKGIQFDQPGASEHFPPYDFRAGKLVAESMKGPWVPDPCDIPSYGHLENVSAVNQIKNIDGVDFTRIEAIYVDVISRERDITYIGEKDEVCYRFLYSRFRDLNMTEKDDERFDDMVSRFRLLTKPNQK